MFIMAGIANKSHRAVYEKFKDGTVKDISDELPFEIPTTWRWVRFGDVALNRDAERIPLSKDQRSHLAKNFDYYGASGVIDKVDKYLFDKPLLLVGEDGANLLARSTPIAFIASGKYWVNNHAHVIDAIEFDLLKYLETFINAIPLTPYITGTAQPKMNQEKMNGIVIALPPLAEQKRIVAKLEKLMPLVEEYGKMEETRLQLDADLPAMLEKSILQDAIQGKLVPQDPNDEPASELLKRIAAERKALVKAGKLKRDKSETVIFRGSDRLAYETRNGVTVRIQDEIPFEIPDSWEWVRLGDLVDTESGLSYRKEDLTIKDNSMVRVLRGGNILDGEFVFKDDDVFIARKMLSGCPTIHRFDFVLPAVTSHVHLGKTALFRDDLNDTCAGGFLLMLHLLFKDIHLAEYLLLYFQSRTYKDYCKTIANKSGQAFFNLSRKKLLQTPIPIPPIAEQSRIVERMRIIKEQIISLTM